MYVCMYVHELTEVLGFHKKLMLLEICFLVGRRF